MQLIGAHQEGEEEEEGGEVPEWKKKGESTKKGEKCPYGERDILSRDQNRGVKVTFPRRRKKEKNRHI